ncbi:homeobox protein Hox-A3-like, partial [Saccostrea cucullata]|uniref:homeobox protein Hox-A3-like n=1 Tax=Saccostrea cuccullata TaxID=36930 RepID=UPI002ED4CDCB
MVRILFTLQLAVLFCTGIERHPCVCVHTQLLTLGQVDNKLLLFKHLFSAKIFLKGPLIASPPTPPRTASPPSPPPRTASPLSPPPSSTSPPPHSASPPPVTASIKHPTASSSPVPNPTPNSPIYFKGEHHILSNFYPCVLMFQGLTFQSSEHLYQYLKAVEHSDPYLANQIQNAPTAKISKQISKLVNTTSHWHSIKNKIMLKVLAIKFNQCAEFKNYLLSTNKRVLIHNVADSYWGTGWNGKGKNIQGKLLMQFRHKMANATSAPSVSSPTVPAPIPTTASSIPHPVPIPSPPAAPATISPITMHPVTVQGTASAPSIPAHIPTAASSIPPASAPSITPATSHPVLIRSPSAAPLITLPIGPTTASSVETPTSPQSPVQSISYSERIAVIGQNHVLEIGNSVANGS